MRVHLAPGGRRGIRSRTRLERRSNSSTDLQAIAETRPPRRPGRAPRATRPCVRWRRSRVGFLRPIPFPTVRVGEPYSGLDERHPSASPPWAQKKKKKAVFPAQQPPCSGAPRGANPPVEANDQGAVGVARPPNYGGSRRKPPLPSSRRWSVSSNPALSSLMSWPRPRGGRFRVDGVHLGSLCVCSPLLAAFPPEETRANSTSADIPENPWGPSSSFSLLRSGSPSSPALVALKDRQRSREQKPSRRTIPRIRISWPGPRTWKKKN